MEQQYGQYNIKFNESLDKWEAFEGEDMVSKSESLANLKANLDKRDRNGGKVKFTPVPILELDYYNTKISEGKLTSITEEGEFWVSIGRDRSKKWNSYQAILDTPENRKRLERILDLKKAIHKLDEEVEAEKSATEKYQPKQ